MASKEQVLEQALGQSVDLVDWRKRMKEGWLVTLTIKHWRARTKLGPGRPGHLSFHE